MDFTENDLREIERDRDLPPDEPYGGEPDPDYSPEYQDEYQRLWHKSAAEARMLREVCRPVVEKYGRHYLKDEDYYRAATLLGLEDSASE
jgi:hypothetical protein